MKKCFFCAAVLLAGFCLWAPSTLADDKRPVPPDDFADLQAEVKRNPDDALSHYNLASAWHDMGQRDKAIAEYKEALRIDPGFAEAHNNLGSVYFQLGKNEDAIGEYEKALSLSPDYPEAHFGLGLAHYLKREEAKALPHLQRAEELFDRADENEKRRQVTRMLTVIKMKSRARKNKL